MSSTVCALFSRDKLCCKNDINKQSGRIREIWTRFFPLMIHIKTSRMYKETYNVSMCTRRVRKRTPREFELET